MFYTSNVDPNQENSKLDENFNLFDSFAKEIKILDRRFLD